MTGETQPTTARPVMTAEEIEIWRHWDTAQEIAEEVERFHRQGGEMHDITLIEVIQAVLRKQFPTLGEQDNGLGIGPVLPNVGHHLQPESEAKGC